ncbi:MAG: adenylate kinase [Chitinophagales bacterium]|nr:adenylate kinase [Chitinophagales bacterium]
MINIVLFGPPGCGKGTQASKMVDKYNLCHISTGDLFRSEITGKTALGMEAKAYMDKGELVPDSVTINMLKLKMQSLPDVNGFIFDGFPRTIPQAEALDNMLQEMNEPVSKMISLKVRDEELVKRLLMRGEASGRADDLSEDVIWNRVRVYNEQTLPVASHYQKQSKLVEINGEESIEEVFGEISKILDSL